MNEKLTKIAQVLNDSEVNGSGIYKKRSAYENRVAYLSVMEFGGDAEVQAAAKLFKAAPKLLEALDEMLDDIGRANSMPSAIKARAAIREATE